MKADRGWNLHIDSTTVVPALPHFKENFMPAQYHISLPDPSKARGNDPDLSFHSQGAAGFAEDETNKIFAIRAYEQGDFTVNAEHPMLMKMLCYVSVNASALWNRAAGERTGLAISEETALRLPNATFGALTVIPLFLLATALLGIRVGIIASLLWATGLNAIWFNRIVKEDTLLIFFMVMGFYLYNRAKTVPESNPGLQEKVFAMAGAAFGLMMCSKYFPHYFGINALFYHLAGYNGRNNRPLGRRSTLAFFAAMLLAFILFNPAVFVPQGG